MHGSYGGYGGNTSGDIHDIVEEFDSSICLKKVVDLEGSTIAEGLDFDEDYFMKEDPFDGLEPDDEDYSGFTGNEGVSTTHFYHHTVKHCTITHF